MTSPFVISAFRDIMQKKFLNVSKLKFSEDKLFFLIINFNWCLDSMLFWLIWKLDIDMVNLIIPVAFQTIKPLIKSLITWFLSTSSITVHGNQLSFFMVAVISYYNSKPANITLWLHGYKRIRQLQINWCTSPMMKHKLSFL